MTHPKAKNRRTPAAAGLLGLASVLVATAGISLGIAVLAEAARADQATPVSVIGSIAICVFGIGAGSALLGLGILLWRQEQTVRLNGRASQALERLSEALAAEPSIRTSEEGAPPLPAAASDSQLLRRVLEELRQVNAALLLDEDQRRRKRLALEDRQSRELLDEARRASETSRFQDLRRIEERIRGEELDDRRREELLKCVADVEAVARRRDIRSETRRIEDLMSTAAFDTAEEAAAALVRRHPESEEVTALVERVRREHEAYAAERRQALHAEVQEHVTARRWRPALAAARRLLSECPGAPEAEAVSDQMPVLRENAQIEEVRSLRDTARDLIQRHRFGEAVRVADDILSRFPDSLAASELREQLPRLRERAVLEGSPAG